MTILFAPSADGLYALRPYQQQAVESILAALESHDAVLCVMATGLGKTVTAAHVARRVRGGVLFLAHRLELIQQAARKFEEVCDEPVEIEKAGVFANEHDPARIVIASTQTMFAGRERKRMERFRAGRFDLIIVDECHHYTATRYREVVDHFRGQGARIIGLTATPRRSDEAALGRIFQDCPYIYELPDAIDDGWLVPLKVSTHRLESLDLSEVHTSRGDFAINELSDEMRRHTAGIVPRVLEVSGDRKTLVFATSVSNAEAMCALFNAHRPDCAMMVHGGTPEHVRKMIFRDYAEGRFKILCNCAIATEGFDAPDIEVIAIARPTKSLPLYMQIIGRGTRPLAGTVDGIAEASDRRAAIAASAKPALTVLDFIGHAGRHKLVRCVDALAGKYDDDVVEAARRRMDEAARSGEAIDVASALEEAEREKEERVSRREKRRAGFRAHATWSSEAVDPFDIFDLVPAHLRGWDRGCPATDRQRAVLLRAGIAREVVEKIEKRRASQLIEEIFRRRDAGLPGYRECVKAIASGAPLAAPATKTPLSLTEAQDRLLRRYGVERPDLTKSQAGRLIGIIARHGWRPSRELQEAISFALDSMPKLDVARSTTD